MFALLGHSLPPKEWTWSAGLMAQALYAKRHGRQPPKDLRPKTRGPGVHCFALYPRAMLPELRDICATVIDYDSHQSTLDL